MTTEAQAGTALYLYCVGVPGECSCGGVAGIDESFPPFVLTRGNLAAVASEVPVAAFCGPDAERRLENLEWVGERALRHEAVVERMSARAPVLPVRFGTLFSREEALGLFLDSNRDAIRDFLESARGRQEWGVKAFLDRTTAIRWLAASAAESTDAAAPVSPGLRYLREKRAQAAAQNELRRWVAEICEAAADAIRECAEEVRSRKLIESVEDGTLEAVMNAAVLLRRERSTDLHACIARLNAAHQARAVHFTASGPWPLYSFCPPLQTP